MDFTKSNSRGKRGELLGRIDRQNSRFRTAKTIIIKFGLHASFVELESAKNAVNETVLETKRVNFVDDALIYAESLCEELEISFKPPRRIQRKHIFDDGSKDVQLSYEDDEVNNVFFNRQSNCCNSKKIPTVAESCAKICFLRPEVILNMEELNLDKAPQDK
ncbi:uncharacterized protein TNCV_1229661 [Trichonephila clavipes]|nr:uncharacterized protein TNCV_1229661 [Trichonephila clavipes]